MNTQNKVEKTQKPLTPEGEEFQRRVNKLIKHGALEVTKDGTRYTLKPTLEARKPRTEAAKIGGGKLGVGGVLLGGATANAVKSGGGILDIGDRNSQSFDGHHVPDGLGAGVSAAAAVGYGAAGILNAKKFQVECQTAQHKMAQAALYAQAAHDHMVSEGKQGSWEAYVKFCTHTEPVFGKSGHRSTSSLNKQVYGLNIPRYFANMGAAVSSLVGAVAKLGHVASANLTITTTFSTTVTTTVATTVAAVATTVTAGVLTFLGAGCEAGVAYAQDKKARRELKENRRTSENLEQWDKDNESKATELDKVTAEAAASERKRRRDAHKLTRKNAKVSFAKAGFATGIGVLTLALFFTVSIATAGIAAGVLGGIFAAVCLTYGVVQAKRELKAARETKRSQRQARALMSAYSIEAIKNGMSQEEKHAWFNVTTNERKGFFTRDRTDHKELVNIRDNGYVAVEIWAHELAEKFSKLNWNDPETQKAINAIYEDAPTKPDDVDQKQARESGIEKGKAQPANAPEILDSDTVKILSRLKAGGMSLDALRVMCQLGMSKSESEENASESLARRSALMRPHIAAAEKLAWTSEKAAPPKKEPVKSVTPTASLDAKSANAVAAPLARSGQIASAFSTVSLAESLAEEQGSLAPSTGSEARSVESKESPSPKRKEGIRPLIPSFSQQGAFALKSAKPAFPSRGNTDKVKTTAASPSQVKLADKSITVESPASTGEAKSPSRPASAQQQHDSQASRPMKASSATSSPVTPRKVAATPGQNATSSSVPALITTPSAPDFDSILNHQGQWSLAQLAALPDLPSIPPAPQLKVDTSASSKRLASPRSSGASPQPRPQTSSLQRPDLSAAPATPRPPQSTSLDSTQDSTARNKSTDQTAKRKTPRMSASPSKPSSSELIALDAATGSKDERVAEMSPRLLKGKSPTGAKIRIPLSPRRTGGVRNRTSNR